MGIMIPTETILGETVSPYLVDLNDYQTELVKTMPKSWAIARENMVCSAETKMQYDKHAQKPQVKEEDRVMVHMSGDLQGKDHKLAHPYHGPYNVLKVTPNNAEVVLVDCPKEPSFFWF